MHGVPNGKRVDVTWGCIARCDGFPALLCGSLNEAPRVIQDEVRRDTVDTLAATVLALVVLCAVVEVPIFLRLGGLATQADLADDHGVVVPSRG